MKRGEYFPCEVVEAEIGAGAVVAAAHDHQLARWDDGHILPAIALGDDRVARQAGIGGEGPPGGAIAVAGGGLGGAVAADIVAPARGQDALAVPDAVILIEQPEPGEIARRRPDLARDDEIAAPVRLRHGAGHADFPEERAERE